LGTFKLKDVTLILDHAAPRPKALYAMDLSHVNAALALKGAAPVDVILGVDVFEKQAAVIDYGTNSLFLKDADLKEPESHFCFAIWSEPKGADSIAARQLHRFFAALRMTRK
jgi:hypothetical protein